MHRFAQMLENQYGKLKIQIPDELLPFRIEAVADILKSIGTPKNVVYTGKPIEIS